MAPWRRAGGAFLVSAIGLLLPIPAGPRPGMSTWGGGGPGPRRYAGRHASCRGDQIKFGRCAGRLSGDGDAPATLSGSAVPLRSRPSPPPSRPFHVRGTAPAGLGAAD
jgi:hypothetical protein